MTPTRTESFVPLISAPARAVGECPEFRVTVVAQSGKGKKKQSAAGAMVPGMSAPGARGTVCEPKVNLQRDGNRVTGIQVHCSCGQVMELACVYDAAAAQAATIPQPQPTAAKAESADGKICNDSGKNLPASAAKEPKVP
jgi:hypothetical protein